MRQLAQRAAAPVTAAPSALAIDGGFLYWSCASCGTIKRKPLLGGVSSTVVSGSSSPRPLAFDDSYVYYGTSTSLRRIHK